MILDYNYNKYKKNLSVSYVTDKGGKRVLNFNVDRFKTFYSTPNGDLTNWDGSKCAAKWTETPDDFDIRTYLKELPEKYRTLITGKTFPKLYTFDIETDIGENDEFPDPATAKYPITTISIVSPEMNCIILGTKDLDERGREYLDKNFKEYVESISFFKELKMPTPYVKYIKFGSEIDMIKYFLMNVVAKVPVLAGWNSILFDWQYIQNRLTGYYSNTSIACSSLNYTTYKKNYQDLSGKKVLLTMPCHTIILDMMDTIKNYDLAVMPIKDDMSLEYVSSSQLGRGKIKYDGDLKSLYRDDYPRYVFYNAIDSILVQLLNQKFRTMNNIYAQAIYCEEKVSKCFSKIALSECLFWDYFYNNGMKVVAMDISNRERGSLLGAFVHEPVAGLHSWVCCNDFSSLYPSSIISANLSIENYIGHFWDEQALSQYRNNPKYIVVGCTVCENDGTPANPKAGREIGKFTDEAALKKYKEDPNYFVSVNGTVYKNDKDYAFRIIQRTLKANRATGKYLAKQLDAQVISDIDHTLEGRTPKEEVYNDRIVETLKGEGYDNITKSSDLKSLTREQLQGLKLKTNENITYFISYEQGMKLLMNSMYGGSSHVAFEWYNMDLANDITGEGKNLIHLMEDHITSFMQEKWWGMDDLRKDLGVELADDAKVKMADKQLVQVVGGDTDSCAGDTVITTDRGDITIEDLYNQNKNNYIGTTKNGSDLVRCTDKVLNYGDDDKNLTYNNINYIMRHKVTKPKWRLKTKSGKEIVITNDHSMIVFRDGKKLTVKPCEIKKTDKILIVVDE